MTGSSGWLQGTVSGKVVFTALRPRSTVWDPTRRSGGNAYRAVTWSGPTRPPEELAVSATSAERTVTLHGHAFSYTDSGSGPALLFIHGILGLAEAVGATSSTGSTTTTG